MQRLESALAVAAEAVNRTLDKLVPPVTGAERRVVEAMRYALMGGGKRIRPFLVLNGARLFDVPEEGARRTAAAIEMVHSYSLVHDDLPAMDNADLRRGRPSVHRQFDEATAILAGDGLLTQAFEVLADPATHADPLVRAELALALARAAGAAGMVGGQMIDLEAQHATLDLEAITRLQRMKTGAIIGFSCIAGAILASAPKAAHQALELYAEDLGLAFQIADDLLDVESSEAVTGKPVGQDQAAGKATFVAVLGVDEARRRATFIADRAASHLDLFGNRADLLRDMAHFVVNRRS
ncbi:MAG TPA: farnesyl diphosphate synthase [Methylomirabilota bacterium]|nr:farnesyl diphosphate synthase [Methylomirabilota bacterium]